MRRIGMALFQAIAMAVGMAGQEAVGASNEPQSNAEPHRFEVASVKPSGPYVTGTPINGPGSGGPGRWTFPRSTLSHLLMRAYDLQPDQIKGPGWLSDVSYTYAVAVTMGPNTTEEQFRSMLQTLLEERFRVRLHRETQHRPGYELVIAQGGAKLKEWTPPADGTANRNAGDVDGFPRLATTGQGVAMRIPRAGQPVLIHMRDSMDAFCRGLGNMIRLSNGTTDLPRVVNNTGLMGIYEFVLRFATPVGRTGTMAANTSVPSDPAALESAGGEASIFAALEEQLGLRLRKVQSLAVTVLAIDSAEIAPTEN
jgi:uncharacterized protein (TIGR03435 family)